MKWKFSSDKAIYVQIVERFKEEISSGRIKSGEKLPSVRETAEEAGVNPNTVQHAFSKLEREGLVHSSGTNGRYVTGDVNLIQAAKAEMAKREIETFLNRMLRLGYKREQTLEIIKIYAEADKTQQTE